MYEMVLMDVLKYIIILIFVWSFFCAIVLFICAIWCLFSLSKFHEYLIKYHNPIWKKLKSNDAIYYWSYVFKDESEPDQILWRKKHALKISTKYALIWFGIFALSIILGLITGSLFKWKGLI